MSYCKERDLYGRKSERHKSRFLNDLDKKNVYVEQDRTTFGHMSKDEADQYKKDFFSDLINGL